MRTLLLMRHAKAESGGSYQSDHERPLAAPGRRAAQLMGRFLTGADEAPDHVITSTAVRAQTTVELAHEAGRWSCPVRAANSLYGAGLQDLLSEIRNVPDQAVRLLLAGHEPTCSRATAQLGRGGSVHFPTAAVSCIRFNADRWQDIEPATGTLVWLVNPKLLSFIK